MAGEWTEPPGAWLLLSMEGGHHLEVSGQGRLSSDILKSFLHSESTEYRGISGHPKSRAYFQPKRQQQQHGVKKGQWDRPCAPGGNLKSLGL